MFERIELQILNKRIKEPRKFIQVVMGPRQVGKTTMVSQLFKQLSIPGIFESADAIAAGNTIWLQQIWEAARLKMKTQKANEFLLIIDEIQKIPNWSETIKKLWDEDSLNNIPLKLILLGSSRLLLQQGLSESLAGRFETIYMTHWTLEEMFQAFGWDADRFAWFGGYPGSAGLIQDEMRWKKYICDSIIETSISKDILMLTRIDKPALLKNLFELGCVYSGQIVSLTKMQGQLLDAGNTTTLSHYLRLLDTAGLLGGLEKFAHTVIRKRSGSPKFQVHNNALLSAQDIKTLPEIQSNPSGWGRVVESAVGSHLINQSLRNNFSVYYWRDRNDEVDFILEKGQKTIALEIKASFIKNKKGMETFQRRFHPVKTYLIDNNGIPWSEFLKINPVDLF
ncbi:MAG: ATP-binding protein [Bacteroidales bacterium]|nr:ATP-binding protein [Bacteroidales bacterium]